MAQYSFYDEESRKMRATYRGRQPLNPLLSGDEHGLSFDASYGGRRDYTQLSSRETYTSCFWVRTRQPSPHPTHRDNTSLPSTLVIRQPPTLNPPEPQPQISTFFTLEMVQDAIDRQQTAHKESSRPHGPHLKEHFVYQRSIDTTISTQL